MDVIQQILRDIERKHKESLAQLKEQLQAQQAQHEQQLQELRAHHEQQLREQCAQHEEKLREQRAHYKARIFSLRTNAGLERERRVQEAAFDEKVFSRLCSWVKSDYDPAKYPPNVHTLVQALTVEPGDETSDDSAGPHEASYHRLASFRDFIIQSFRVIGAAIVRQQDGFLTQEAEIELAELQVQNRDLQWECEMAESQIGRLKSEVCVNQSKVYQLLSVLTRLGQRLDKSERKDLSLFLERFGYSEQQHEICDESGSGSGSDGATVHKRKRRESPGEIGRNVRARVEDEKNDSQSE